MTPLVLLAALVLGPALIAVFLRVNAAILFMSLCVGELLVQNVSSDTVMILTSASEKASSVSQSTVELGLLLTPVILTMVFMFHSVHGTKSVVNILPAIGFGLMSALLVKPLLSPSFQKTLEQASVWHQILQAQTFIVALSAILALLFLWMQGRSKGHSEHSHHSKRH